MIECSCLVYCKASSYIIYRFWWTFYIGADSITFYSTKSPITTLKCTSVPKAFLHSTCKIFTVSLFKCIFCSEFEIFWTKVRRIFRKTVVFSKSAVRATEFRWHSLVLQPVEWQHDTVMFPPSGTATWAIFWRSRIGWSAFLRLICGFLGVVAVLFGQCEYLPFVVSFQVQVLCLVYASVQARLRGVNHPRNSANQTAVFGNLNPKTIMVRLELGATWSSGLFLRATGSTSGPSGYLKLDQIPCLLGISSFTRMEGWFPKRPSPSRMRHIKVPRLSPKPFQNMLAFSVALWNASIGCMVTFPFNTGFTVLVTG